MSEQQSPLIEEFFQIKLCLDLPLHKTDRWNVKYLRKGRKGVLKQHFYSVSNIHFWRSQMPYICCWCSPTALPVAKSLGRHDANIPLNGVNVTNEENIYEANFYEANIILTDNNSGAQIFKLFSKKYNLH